MITGKQSDKKVWWFFAVTLSFTWICQLPLTLASHDIIDDVPVVHYLNTLAMFGPFLAACLLTYLDEGTNGTINLIKRGWDTRFRKVWWLPTLLLLPAMQYLAVAASSLIEGRGWPQLSLSTQPWLYLSFPVIFFQVIGEEYGWRGYAIERLQGRWNAVVSSLILGAFWGIWHIQLWMRAGELTRTSPFMAAQFYIFVQTILYTWLYNNTGGSLLPVLLYHALDNFLGSKITGIYDTFAGSMAYFIIVLLVTAVVVILWGSRRLMRENTVVENK
jgi:membrane protease YdiL (CAAX protease family)